MLQTESYSITNELVSTGAIPLWLQDHIRWQSISPISNPKERKNKLMIIYPNEESRKEYLSKLGAEGYAFDRKLHQTIDSLHISLLADYRLPRLLPIQEGFNIVLHEECAKEAKNLAFPSINPIPDMEWGRGKTAQLVKLHTYLSKEGVEKSWNGPGIHSFRKILVNLENKIGGTHPDLAYSRINEKLISSEKPFTLFDIDGIIMLNHPPGLPKSQKKILLSISKHCPIHQLVYAGNFRLGHHGYLLIDQFPVKSIEDLPNFLPIHDIENENKEMNVTIFQPIREKHSFQLTSSIVSKNLESNSKTNIIIVDPSLDNNKYYWENMINNLGLIMNESAPSIRTNSLGHWLRELISLGHGENSFSLEKLRLISLQKSIIPFESNFKHPSNPDVKIIPDQNLLTNTARSEHVLGGPGALRRWLETLSRTCIDDDDSINKESTQWWLLNLANSIHPLLTGEDKAALNENQFRIGCKTGVELPIIIEHDDADTWLLEILKSSNDKLISEPLDLESVTCISVIQSLTHHHQSLRNMQFLLNHRFSNVGPEWVEEYLTLTNLITNNDPKSKIISRIRILTPEQSLGCSADLIILANLSSKSWDMRVPKIPFVGEEERHRLNLLRPDGPIRNARHFLQHLLFASNNTIILDTSLDDTSPSSAPIREFITINDKLIKEFDGPIYQSPRDIRQLEGNNLQKGLDSIYPSINPDSITIPFDVKLQRERERRQPNRVGNQHYLPEDSRKYIFSIESNDLSRKVPTGSISPRDFENWPVVGGYTNEGKKTPSIDPRPFIINSTGINVTDNRHGHSSGTNQSNQIWSPSRLHDWLKCPRSGWLTRGLKVKQEELQSEDLDARTQGELIHLIHHDIICNILDIEIGATRNNDKEILTPISVAKSGLTREEVMKIALEALDKRAPWLDRTDAVSSTRLQILTGMSRNQWNDWLANPSPVKISGRIGTIVEAEFTIPDSMPISIEWDMKSHDDHGIEIFLPPELTSPNLQNFPTIRVQGQIDRVDQLPFDNEGKVWINEEGNNSIAPLKFDVEDWKPRRLIVIRDLKTTESKSDKVRQASGLLEELQLAIYSRAWEIAHPGDLVVGAGISIFSHNTTHMLEMSSNNNVTSGLRIGDLSTFTTNLFRFMDDMPSPNSDPFRAWLTQRLSVALGVADGAMEGRVHPTPSKDTCRYCSVRETCDVRMEDGY